MIVVVKIIVFFLALFASFALIEDVIERIILASKRKYEDYHDSYVRGYTTLFEGILPLYVIILWTAFYVLNLL